MRNREKVIKGLEQCLICDTSLVAPEEAQNAYLECEYTVGRYCRQKELLLDALSLLKEQEAVEPFHRCIGEEHMLIEDSHFDYCPYCGKPILWEGR